MERLLQKQLKLDIVKKIAIITGPRQSGKTTLSKNLSNSFDYLNYDFIDHRMILKERSWDRKKEIIILDEIHKMDRWKSWLKGIYDVEGNVPHLVVTGSAKLSAFKKVGDSLAGRHFVYRLHPLDLKEIILFTDLKMDEAYQRLMEVGGFPEPFLMGTKSFYNRWKRSHIDLILKEDLLDLSLVRDIKSIEILIELLRKRVASPVSINSLARDLQKSPKTVKAWIELLENLYVIFKISPYSHNIARSILKEPKYYFYDNAMVIGDKGVKLENLVANALLKEVHFKQDIIGENYSLHYLRTKDNVEVDFLVTKENIPQHMIEVKLSDTSMAVSLMKFFKENLEISRTQLVETLEKEKTYPCGVEIRDAVKFLATLDI